MKISEIKTCSPKCRSAQHALDLISLLTKTNDTHILLSGLMQCWNSHKIHDNQGRDLLHVAASCGRAEVCEWLLEYKKAEINLKTFENGWTPAHCACFYGNIDSLIILIKHGANLTKNDYDRLTPIENLIIDKWTSTKYDLSPDFNDDLDVYSWGSNENFNLGMGHEMKKTNAEMVEFFKKSNIGICQIKMSKFHSVFLSKSGDVYTCGFGVDGRLGHDNEQTLFLPKLVEHLKNQKCIQIDASRNNTYFLTSEGVVFSCGTNDFKQLGQIGVSKSLSPRQISPGKHLRGKPVKQIACGKFHCVLLTKSNEVYSFGLNAGQLGHPNEMVANATSYNSTVCYISEPRLITSLNEPDIDISIVACSDGCTVCLQPSKNLLHVFNDYKSRRLYYIKETGAPFKKIKVIGGKLDHCANPDLKWIKDYTDPITIVGLTDNNLLYVWKEQDNVWRNLSWSGNKNIKIVDFDLNDQGIVYCTIYGSCYKADFKSGNKTPQKHQPMSELAKSPSNPNVPSEKSNNFNFELKVEILDAVRIPFLNRCVSVMSDLKGRNFSALQFHPNTNMRLYPIEAKSVLKANMREFLEESLSIKEFYDIELKFKDKLYGLHKFILFTRCPKLFLKAELLNKTRIDLDQLLSQKFSSFSFEILLYFIYTNECQQDLIKRIFKANKITSETAFSKFLTDFKETCIDKFGFSELKSSFDTNNYLKLLKEMNLNSKENEEKLNLMSKFFCQLLELKISKAGSSMCHKRKQLKFSRNSFPELYDCQIELNNEQTIQCHKCLLIARSEFFRNMLLGSWLESTSASIKLPFDLDLMQIFIDYLYTDEIQLEFIHANTNHSVASLKSKSEKEIEILFNLYVLSDQLLMERLKNLCEFKLANLVNLKNVTELFEFSAEYEAAQLKEFCMEFISNNLVTLIESKQLEPVNLTLLNHLSKFYRSYYPIIDSRRITPYTGGLDPEKIELIPFEFIYDQNLNETDETVVKRRISSNSFTLRGAEEKKETQKTTTLADSPIENDADQTPEIVQEKEKSENNLKWEKVKKKNRRKISEKDVDIPSTPKTPVGGIFESPKQKTSPNNQVNSCQPLAGAFYTEKDIEKYSEQKMVRNDSIKLQETKQEWPSLGDSTPDKKPDKEVLSNIRVKSFKPTKTSPISLATSKPVISPSVLNKPKEMKSEKPAWGSTPIPAPTTSNFSLLDIINEEIKKVNISRPVELTEDKPVPVTKKSPQTHVVNLINDSQAGVKGWNLAMNSMQEKSSANSFASIIEMEKRSKEHYNKLKNRPLNSIQLEEKAIEDLKMLYQVNDITDMTISIELIDEAEFSSCAPIWKKN